MWLKELPYTISVPSMAILVVHAGIVPGVPLHLQLREDMVTMRNLDSLLDGMSTHSTHSAKSTRSNSDTWSATASPKVGRSWAEVYCDGNYMTTEDGRPIHIYFGHDAKRGLQRLPYATGLDTGCCYGEHHRVVLCIGAITLMSSNPRRLLVLSCRSPAERDHAAGQRGDPGGRQVGVRHARLGLNAARLRGCREEKCSVTYLGFTFGALSACCHSLVMVCRSKERC